MHDLKTRPCNLSDFGLDNNSTASANQTFYSPLEKKKSEFRKALDN
jgi:hypothetical protein